MVEKEVGQVARSVWRGDSLERRMAMPEWQSGLTARLKSGGPAMTVSAVVDGVVVCLWFEGKKMRTGQFAPDALEELNKVPDSTRGPFFRDCGRGFMW